MFIYRSVYQMKEKAEKRAKEAEEQEIRRAQELRTRRFVLFLWHSLSVSLPLYVFLSVYLLTLA